MPSRGYRKGVADGKEPVTRSIRTHVTEHMFAAFIHESDQRGLTYSKLLFAIVRSHQTGKRLKVPQPRKLPDALMRQLANALNNLNQLTRQANTGIVPVNAAELRATMLAIENVARAVRD